MLYTGLPRFWADYFIYISTATPQELMKSVGGHGSLSLLFVMKGGDGPLLCGQPSQGCYDHTHCYYLLIVVVISL
jgi:hypothetical protein